MTVPTTCLGAWPKPAYAPIADWFQVGHESDTYTDQVMRGWQRAQSPKTQELLDRATAEVVADQVACGIDVVTDGEVRRENYVHYQCRHFDGFDFETLTRRTLRNGAYMSDLPSIRGPVRSTGSSPLVRDWQVAQAAAGDTPVKMTLPGPLTISDTTADCFYDDAQALAADLANALNAEVHALVAAGCRHIQIDEPVFARKPDLAVDYGVDALAACFAGVPGGVTRIMHMCCGYPSRLDDTDYPKADAAAYLTLAAAVDGVVDHISIEDAHRHNPTELFERFETSTLVVGFVRIASSRLESVDEIADRIGQVRKVLGADRLVAAPDCGLGFLNRDLAMAKLTNLVAAASSVR